MACCTCTRVLCTLCAASGERPSCTSTCWEGQPVEPGVSPSCLPLCCLLQVPADEEGNPWLSAALTVGVLGTIAYRRPRAAAFFAGAVTLMAAPYLGFAVVTVNRFSKVGLGMGNWPTSLGIAGRWCANAAAWHGGVILGSVCPVATKNDGQLSHQALQHCKL